MDDDALRRQIRGTHTEKALLAVEEAGGHALHSTLIEAVGGEPVVASHAAANLRALGLAQKAQTAADETRLTPQGRQVAAAIKRSRTSGPERWDAVARAIAVSVSDEGRMAWNLDEVDGLPVTDAETRVAVHKLEQWGLVKTLKAAGGQIVGVMPLDPIYQVPGIDGLLTDYFEGYGVALNDYSNTTTIGDGNTIGGVQTGGQNNTQTVTMTISQDERLAIVHRTQELLDQLPAEADRTVREPLEALRADAATGNTTLSDMKSKVLQSTSAAIGTGLGGAILAGLAELGKYLLTLG
jgi:hypothetical protein